MMLASVLTTYVTSPLAEEKGGAGLVSSHFRVQVAGGQNSMLQPGTQARMAGVILLTS
jgi:hypothetical protein